MPAEQPLGMHKPSSKLSKKLNDRQERLGLVAVKDFDRVRAYRAAGYSGTTDEVAATEACRLLKNPHVHVVILREKAKIAARLGFDAQTTLQHFVVIYMEAMKALDYRGAVMALDKIAKHYGLYEKHNQQLKCYVEEDAEKLRTELEQAGFDFERAAFQEWN